MAMKQTGALWLLIKSAMTGALGGLLFGFDTAVIAGAIDPLTVQYGLNEWSKGFTVSIALIGTVIGSMSAGWLGQKYGSRAALRMMAVLYVISALGCAFAPGWVIFLAARFLGGLGIGGSSVLGPVYIAELAPAKWRGRLVGLFQIMVVAGILLAYLSNFIVSQFHFGAVEWRWELGVAVVPAVLFMVLLLSVPPSSRWLVSQNRIDEAILVLAKMGSPDSKAEVDAILASIAEDGGAGHSELFTRRHALPIFLAITLAMFNQLTGINAILYYLNDVFASAGFGAMSAGLQAVAVGAANMLATFAGIALIDKLGRKTLLLIGAVGDCFALAGVAWVYSTHGHENLLLPLLIVFILFFAVSQGAVIWVYLSEVFPTLVRSKGQGLGCSTHWIMAGLVTQLFPVVFKHSHAAPYVFFSAMMVVQFFAVLFVFPETKGMSLEDLQHRMQHGGVVLH